MLYITLILLIVIIFYLILMYLYMNILKRKEILYDIDVFKKVKITKDIIYKSVDNKELLMDIYTPEEIDSEEKLPVVIFVHGEGPEVFINDVKDWGTYSSYGRLLGSMGFVAVTFNHRYAGINYKKVKAVAEDVTDAVNYIGNNAEQWNIDSEKICLWSFSLGGLYSGLSLKENKINCLVSYNGFHDIYTKMPKFDSIYEEVISNNYLLNSQNGDGSILIVKAVRDKANGVNKFIDNFIKMAKEYKLRVEYIVHNTGGHSFDVLDDNEETREVIEKTLKYIEQKCR